MSLSVAIVGSGPAGFYTADAFLKAGADVRIDIVERLPAPFGLIRGGVAPDHQSTKGVSRSFEKMALDPALRYYGNVEVGRDVTLDELSGLYDAVVLATGAPQDRPLGIPGEDKAGVYGAAAFVGWYNAHPDFRWLDPDLDTAAVAVIGVGNVAIDIARVLVKTPAEMAESDLPGYAREAIDAGGITDVYMFGRRGPVDAKFTNVELREMGRLEDCHPVVDGAVLPAEVTGEMSGRDRRVREKNLASLRGFTELDPAGKAKRVHFAFHANPVEILGGEKVEGLRLERTRVEGGRAVGTGETFEIACGVVIPAIGYQAPAMNGVPFDAARGVVVCDGVRVMGNVYAAGWIRRGPVGVIGTNKPDGDEVARGVLETTPAGARPGREAFERLLGERAVRWVSHDDWRKIDAAEVANAAPAAPRRKFPTVAEMLGVLGEDR